MNNNDASICSEFDLAAFNTSSSVGWGKIKTLASHTRRLMSDDDETLPHMHRLWLWGKYGETIHSHANGLKDLWRCTTVSGGSLSRLFTLMHFKGAKAAVYDTNDTDTTSMVWDELWWPLSGRLTVFRLHEERWMFVATRDSLFPTASISLGEV
jgi:hypothetical protein